MLKVFRIVSYLEGISFLLLLGIAMPLKYVYGQPQMVRSVGWIHGMLFVGYTALLAVLSSEHHWPRKRTLFGLIAAVLPLGPFFFDRAFGSETEKP